MKSLIGHNQPPIDRKADWKSISINKRLWKELQEIAHRINDKDNCFLLLDGHAPIKKPSIPYVIELLANERTMWNRRFDMQDNGRDIWEQTSKKLLRTYKSKKGLGIKNAK